VSTAAVTMVCALLGVPAGLRAPAGGVHPDRLPGRHRPGDDRRDHRLHVLAVGRVRPAQGVAQVRRADVDAVQTVHGQHRVQVVEGLGGLQHDQDQRLVRPARQPPGGAGAGGPVPAGGDHLADVLGAAHVRHEHALRAEVERPADVGELRAAGAHQRHRAGRRDGGGHAGQVRLGERAVLQIENHVVHARPGQQLGGDRAGQQAPHAVGRLPGRPP
jgi:hypothetical protein